MRVMSGVIVSPPEGITAGHLGDGNTHIWRVIHEGNVRGDNQSPAANRGKYFNLVNSNHAHPSPSLGIDSQLPKHFEAEARVCPIESPLEVLQLVSGRTLLGTVTMPPATRLLEGIRPHAF